MVRKKEKRSIKIWDSYFNRMHLCTITRRLFNKSLIHPETKRKAFLQKMSFLTIFLTKAIQHQNLLILIFTLNSAILVLVELVISQLRDRELKSNQNHLITQVEIISKKLCLLIIVNSKAKTWTKQHQQIIKELLVKTTNQIRANKIAYLLNKNLKVFLVFKEMMNKNW